MPRKNSSTHISTELIGRPAETPSSTRAEEREMQIRELSTTPSSRSNSECTKHTMRVTTSAQWRYLTELQDSLVHLFGWLCLQVSRCTNRVVLPARDGKHFYCQHQSPGRRRRTHTYVHTSTHTHARTQRAAPHRNRLKFSSQLRGSQEQAEEMRRVGV